MRMLKNWRYDTFRDSTVTVSYPDSGGRRSNVAALRLNQSGVSAHANGPSLVGQGAGGEGFDESDSYCLSPDLVAYVSSAGKGNTESFCVGG